MQPQTAESTRRKRIWQGALGSIGFLGLAVVRYSKVQLPERVPGGNTLNREMAFSLAVLGFAHLILLIVSLRKIPAE